jgi:hypothetical protein
MSAGMSENGGHNLLSGHPPARLTNRGPAGKPPSLPLALFGKSARLPAGSSRWVRSAPTRFAPSDPRVAIERFDSRWVRFAPRLARYRISLHSLAFRRIELLDLPTPGQGASAGPDSACVPPYMCPGAREARKSRSAQAVNPCQSYIPTFLSYLNAAAATGYLSSAHCLSNRCTEMGIAVFNS